MFKRNKNQTIKSDKPKSSLDFLGVYADVDSEEELHEDNKQKNDDSAVGMDSKIANFMQEINQDIQKPAKKQVKKQETSTASTEKETQAEENGVWKKLLDVNTKHPYFWNMKTNEVTWSMPDSFLSSTDAKSNEHKPKIKLVESSAGQDPPASKKQKVTGGGALSKEVKKESMGSINPDLILALQEKRKKLKARLAAASQSTSEKPKKTRKGSSDEDSSGSSSYRKRTSRRRSREKRPGSRGVVSESSSSYRGSAEVSVPSNTLLAEVARTATTKRSSSFDKSSSSKSSKSRSNSRSRSPAINVAAAPLSFQATRKKDDAKKKDSSKVPTRPLSSSAAHVDKKPEKDDTQEKAKSSVLLESSKTLLNKLKYLEVNKMAMSVLNVLAVELQVRVEDFKAGELSGGYFAGKLREAEAKVVEYEKSAVLAGWTCEWSSQYSRYYYRNDKTAETQWDYPQAMAGDTAAAAAGTEATTAVVNEENAVEQDEISGKNVVGVSPTISPLTTAATAAAVVTCAASHPSATTYVQTYPYYNYVMYPSCYNGATNTTTTTATPVAVTSSELPPPPPGEDPALPPPLPPSEADQVKPPPPPPACENAADNDEMEISDNESVASAPPLPPSRPIEVQAGPVDYASVPVRFPSAAHVSSATYYSNPISSVDSDSQQPPLPSAPVTESKTKKIKKTKKAVKKPPKQMSGLILKWQEAQNALEEEKLRVLKEAEEEFEAEFDNEKRIAKWKKEQLKNGKAAQNANFEPVSQDWRKRVAAKRQQQGGGL